MSIIRLRDYSTSPGAAIFFSEFPPTERRADRARVPAIFSLIEQFISRGHY
jgi:hypothetical protein